MVGRRVRESPAHGHRGPGDMGHAAAEQIVGRRIRGADGHVGIPFREVERLIAEHDVEPDVVALVLEAGEDRRQQSDQQRVVGGDTQFAGGGQGAAGELAAETCNVVLHALGQRHHLLARCRGRITRAVADEERGARKVLDLRKAAEDGRVVETHRAGRARKAARIGDGLDEAMSSQDMDLRSSLMRHRRDPADAPRSRRALPRERPAA